MNGHQERDDTEEYLPEDLEVLNIEQAAGALAISTKKLLDLIRDGKAPPHRQLGDRIIRFSAQAIRTWLEAGDTVAPPPPQEKSPAAEKVPTRLQPKQFLKSGFRWTKQEDTYLLEHHADGWQACAVVLKRPPLAVYKRARSLIRGM